MGFQQILFSEGGKIVEQNKIYHGFQSNVIVNKQSKLFKKGQILNYIKSIQTICQNKALDVSFLKQLVLRSLKVTKVKNRGNGQN